MDGPGRRCALPIGKRVLEAPGWREARPLVVPEIRYHRMCFFIDKCILSIAFFPLLLKISPPKAPALLREGFKRRPAGAGRTAFGRGSERNMEKTDRLRRTAVRSRKSRRVFEGIISDARLQPEAYLRRCRAGRGGE